MLSPIAPDYWQQALTHLSQDAVMKRLIACFPDTSLTSRRDPFHTLMRAIVGQQVSVASADALWARLEQQCQQRRQSVSPQTIISLDPAILQDCGFSRQKVAYSHNLARFFLEEALTESSWDHMSDAEVTDHITQVKGLGPWSAEMFLIFYLMRPNIYPLGDIGLQRALQKLYHISDSKPFDKDEAIAIAAQWEPYRTVATWFLWRSIDPDVVLY